jgi:hypothetical protein
MDLRNKQIRELAANLQRPGWLTPTHTPDDNESQDGDMEDSYPEIIAPRIHVSNRTIPSPRVKQPAPRPKKKAISRPVAMPQALKPKRNLPRQIKTKPQKDTHESLSSPFPLSPRSRMFNPGSILGTERQNLNPFGRYLFGIYQDLFYSTFCIFNSSAVLGGGDKHPNSSLLFNITESRKKQAAWELNVQAVEAEMGIKIEDAVKAGPPQSKEFFNRMDQLRQTSKHRGSLNSISPESITSPAEIEKILEIQVEMRNRSIGERLLSLPGIVYLVSESLSSGIEINFLS